MADSNIALITGAGGSVGGSVADVFGRAGWTLALVAHSEDSKGKLGQTYPNALVLRADLTQDEAAKEMVQTVERELGRVDALLNIAGGFALQAATEATKGDLEKMLNLNLWTVYNATRAALPGMIERERGFILGIAARQAEEGGAKAGTYAASKAALVAYLKSVQLAVKKRGVGVSILYPMGTIDTEANREAMPDADPESFIALETLAQATLFLAERPKRGRVHELRVHAS